jgi:hypothetical protein
VALEVAGSNPVTHPSFWNSSQAERSRALDPTTTNLASGVPAVSPVSAIVETTT